MWLLIDDLRELACEVTVRTSQAAKTILEKNIKWECICFDHDLGMGQESGYDIMKWAFEFEVMNTERVQLVTSNPVGRKNMENLLISEGFNTKDGINFKYE